MRQVWDRLHQEWMPALYAFEGDYKNAAISATGMIPGAKYATGAAKGLRFAAS
ncbi:hypothetical protein LC087_12815 [Bacillus carboniphilus]|uniref:Uncharacterized protein n=1 Tax=Bacillus carboniphilus TaxID=86663 RepID=A0ABY9JQS6_9BACI|nr:hypothetical protein [Bacillus carboniphilus]WLR41741.1 hypothetical protein LC087_12815 [Bacillus carboniphilus]